MSNGMAQNGEAIVPSIVYKPTEYKINQMVRFMRFVEKIYNTKLKNYWELHEWSYKCFPEFWDCVWKFFDILHSQPYTQVIDKRNDFLNAKWFEGLRFNYTANILKYRDSRNALISLDDHDNSRKLTYKELYDEVKLYIRALKEAGIQKGDKVACYMPNKIEPVLAFSATAAMGAVWCGGLPLLGAKGVIARLEIIKPKILFTSGNFYFEGTEIRMDLKITEVVESLPSLTKVVYVPSQVKSKKEEISSIPKCVLISTFLASARKDLQGDSSEIEFEQVPFDYPLCISFTSGTTGAPKGLIHSVGMFLASLKDYGLMEDCTREDTLFNFSPVGWISWHMFVNCLHLGLTLLMYEGDAFEKSKTRYWDIVDKFGITSSYVWSSTVENMQRKCHVPGPHNSLKTLKQIFPMGSPTKPHSYNFLTEDVKKNLFCCSVYGCTEVFGLINGMDSNLPLYRGEMQAFSLGMDVRILDDNDQPVIGKRGEVVIANPLPCMAVELLNDENKEFMKEYYLSQHPGYWTVGDDAWVNPITKGLVVYGRSDETMNPNGARFNCAEIYFALEGFPGIVDCVCVSQFNSSMDERVVLFVKMEAGCALTEEVKESIGTTVEQCLSVEHVPSLIVQTPDIPYNLTGKKLNGLVKKLINQRPVKNAEIVVNPTSMDFYRTVDLGTF